MEYSPCVSYSGVLWKESESADPIFAWDCHQSVLNLLAGPKLFFPGGSNVAKAAFRKGYIKRRTDERTKIWKEVVLEMPWHVETFFFLNKFLLSENEILFSARERGGFILLS
jgi:hypothetical protein